MPKPTNRWARARYHLAVKEIAMRLFALDIPLWLLDWSGSLMLVVSLIYLWTKRSGYWWWGNASTLPYFLLFLSSQQWLFAGLQASYLLFGVHGQYLWWLERRRDQRGIRFAEIFWYNVGWVLSLLMFVYATAITDLSTALNQIQFAATALALLANWATTRKWVWSWSAWIAVNALQAIFFEQVGYWGLMSLQFILASMSVYGLIQWRAAREPRRERSPA
jgi:nicotinamide mononucleotide transporter